MRSHVNLSAIIRAAGCAGVGRVVATGNAKVIDRVAREGAEHVTVITKNSLAPALKNLKAEGYALVALEQTTNSTALCDFKFPKKCALVIGAERSGLSEECLALVEVLFSSTCRHATPTLVALLNLSLLLPSPY